MFDVAYLDIIAPNGRRLKHKVTFRKGNVKVRFTLLNWIHNSRSSKNPPFPPLKKAEGETPFVKGDLKGFSVRQHDFYETLTCQVCSR